MHIRTAAGAVAVWIVAGLMLISRDDLESPTVPSSSKIAGTRPLGLSLH
jgi:hypothetical protein